MTCVCLAASLDEVRTQLQEALRIGTVDSIFDLYYWCENITEGEGLQLTLDIALSFYEYTSRDSQIFYPNLFRNNEELLKIWQSLLDIGCAPGHWRCEHLPEHKV